MTQFGCLVWTVLLFVLVSGPAILAESSQGRGWLGMAGGVAAWLAMVSGYGVLLAIVDRRRRHNPRPVPDPWWLVGSVVALWVVATVAAVMLLRRAFS